MISHVWELVISRSKSLIIQRINLQSLIIMTSFSTSVMMPPGGHSSSATWRWPHQVQFRGQLSCWSNIAHPKLRVRCCTLVLGPVALTPYPCHSKHNGGSSQINRAPEWLKLHVLLLEVNGRISHFTFIACVGRGGQWPPDSEIAQPPITIPYMLFTSLANPIEYSSETPKLLSFILLGNRDNFVEFERLCR